MKESKLTHILVMILTQCQLLFRQKKSQRRTIVTIWDKGFGGMTRDICFLLQQSNRCFRGASVGWERAATRPLFLHDGASLKACTVLYSNEMYAKKTYPNWKICCCSCMLVMTELKYHTESLKLSSLCFSQVELLSLSLYIFKSKLYAMYLSQR